MTFTRKRQTFILILLTATTLMPSYSLQGWLAGGHAAADLPQWFWIWETVAWSARALIEAGAILFLFETNAQTDSQEKALLLFKVTLIALITLTLGVVVASAGLGQSIAEALPRPIYWLWSFAVASYAPLMLGSVGMAYRIQPHDTNGESEPVTSKAVEKPVSSPKTMIRKSVSPEPKAVDESVSPQISPVEKLPEPEISPVEKTETKSEKSTLWKDLGSDDARWKCYQELDGQTLTEDEIANKFGVTRITVFRMRQRFDKTLQEDATKETTIKSTNGVH